MRLGAGGKVTHKQGATHGPDRRMYAFGQGTIQGALRGACYRFTLLPLAAELVQCPLLRNFSDQFSRSRVEACLLLFFG